MGPGFLSGLSSLGLSSAATSQAGNGATIVGPSGGDWNVNLGGSGVAFQGQTNPLMLAALVAVAVAAVLLLRRG